MPTNAKDLINRLKKEKDQRKKKNITLSLDENIYRQAKEYVERKELTVSEVVEGFLRELINSR